MVFQEAEGEETTGRWQPKVIAQSDWNPSRWDPIAESKSESDEEMEMQHPMNGRCMSVLGHWY